MSTDLANKNAFEDMNIGTRPKLASLWASFMLLYIYVDYFHLYMPGALEEMLAGKVFLFEISQIFLLISLVSVAIPALMIFLSIALSARLNRWINMVVATIYIPYTLFNLAGEAWMHMMLGAVLEVVLLLLIVGHAWKWPRIDT